MSAIPRTGSGLTLADILAGQAISARPAPGWKHPWYTTPAWNAALGRWVATVKPGFVNEQCPVFRTTVIDQEEEGRHYGTNPLTGKEFFSDPVFAQETAAPAEERLIDVPLYFDPAIPLEFRAVGYDGSPEFPVPQFFLDRGAAGAKPLPTLANLDSDDAATDQGPPEGLRLLRACDLWVHQPRLALTSEITFGDGLVTGAAIASQTLGLRSAVPGDALRVLSGTFRDISQTAAIDALAGVFEEPPFDELLIATVFLLSPANTAPGSEPDASWQPYVRHNLFWNLEHVMPWFRNYTGDPSVPFLPPLAAGAAQLVINFFISSLNDILQQALNLVTAHSMRGTFYTATGGGHSAAFPEGEEAELLGLADAGGLNKAVRTRAEALAQRRARISQKLDPAFPYRAEPFDPALLTQTV